MTEASVVIREAARIMTKASFVIVGAAIVITEASVVIRHAAQIMTMASFVIEERQSS